MNDPDQRAKWRAYAESGAVALLRRLIANYETDRSVVADSDLDDEQPIAITFRGTLGDIKTARQVLRCYEALK